MMLVQDGVLCLTLVRTKTRCHDLMKPGCKRLLTFITRNLLDATTMLKILGVVFLFSVLVATAQAGTATLVYERRILAATAASVVYLVSHEMPRNDSGVYY